jgi:hypothetical protein
MRFPIFILCIIIFTQPSTCLGQATNSFVFGKVTDKTDLSPIPYASIWFKSAKYEGTVSNSEGSFKLSIPSNFTSDSVFVSFLGYETVKIHLDQNSLRDSIQVLLPQQIFLLQDIEVLGTSPYTFLQQAALKTSQMSLSPAILNCYYREFISKNGSFTNFADGMVDYFVEKREGKPLFVQVRVNESRAKYVPVVIETKSMGSIDLPQQLDIDMLPYFLDPHRNLNNMVENENEYNFDLYEFADSVGNDFYKVVFTPKQEIKKPLVEGVFLIDKSSSLIHSVLYNVPNSHIEYFKIIKLLFGIRTQQNAATAYIQYEMVGENIQLYQTIEINQTKVDFISYLLTGQVYDQFRIEKKKNKYQLYIVPKRCIKKTDIIVLILFMIMTTV